MLQTLLSTNRLPAQVCRVHTPRFQTGSARTLQKMSVIYNRHRHPRRKAPKLSWPEQRNPQPSAPHSIQTLKPPALSPNRIMQTTHKMTGRRHKSKREEARSFSIHRHIRPTNTDMQNAHACRHTGINTIHA